MELSIYSDGFFEKNENEDFAFGRAREYCLSMSILFSWTVFFRFLFTRASSVERFLLHWKYAYYSSNQWHRAN